MNDAMKLGEEGKKTGATQELLDEGWGLSFHSSSFKPLLSDLRVRPAVVKISGPQAVEIFVS